MFKKIIFEYCKLKAKIKKIQIQQKLSVNNYSFKFKKKQSELMV